MLKLLNIQNKKDLVQRNKEEVLQNELQELDHKICNSDTFDQEILEKYETAKEELKHIHEVRGRVLMGHRKAELFNFLWKDKKDKTKRLVMYQPLADGGLNFVTFPAVVKSLRLAWISRFLSNSRDS